MKGIAYSDADLMEFLPEDLVEYDKMYWLIGDRVFWRVPERNHTADDVEAMYRLVEDCLIETNAFGAYGISLLDKENFSKIAPYIGLDEWTYFVGLDIDKANFEDTIRDPGLVDFFNTAFFESLKSHNATSITYVDEWWECFPADSKLLEKIGGGLKHAETNSEKWIDYSKNFRLPIHPHFD